MGCWLSFGNSSLYFQRDIIILSFFEGRLISKNHFVRYRQVFFKQILQFGLLNLSAIVRCPLQPLSVIYRLFYKENIGILPGPASLVRYSKLSAKQVVRYRQVLLYKNFSYLCSYLKLWVPILAILARSLIAKVDIQINVGEIYLNT